MTKSSFYDDPDYDYRAYWQTRQYEDLADRLALKKLLKKVPKHGPLLEIGAGFGRLSPVYLPFFEKVILTDPSTKMLGRAKKKIRSNRVKFVKAFAEKLPFAKGSFQVVLLIRTCHHLKDPFLAIREISRVLKPGGFFVIEFANKVHLKARLKAFLRFDFHFLSSLKPVKIGQKKQKIPFLNYHPAQIEKMLQKNDLVIKKTLSVSNLRNPFFKKILPLKMLLFLEKIIQEVYAPLKLGPSIFLLCQKKAKA